MMITDRKYVHKYESREVETTFINKTSEILFFLFWEVSTDYSCFFLFNGEFAVMCEMACCYTALKVHIFRVKIASYGRRLDRSQNGPETILP